MFLGYAVFMNTATYPSPNDIEYEQVYSHKNAMRKARKRARKTKADGRYDPGRMPVGYAHARAALEAGRGL